LKSSSRKSSSRRLCSRTRANAALGIAVLAAGCLTSMAQRVEQTEQKLIGVKARDLNRCIGVPFSVDEDGATEYLTYRWLEEEQTDPFDRPLYTPPPVRSDRGTEPDLGADKPPRGVAYCELVFEVRDGRVRSVDVEGRRASGLNDDADCILKAERCIPAP
jgi:hypothetical protein